MILECPNCQTRFLVNSSLIPAGGRDVKCANCGHTWFTTGDEEPPLYAEQDPEMDMGAVESEDRLEEMTEEDSGETVDSLPNIPEIKDTPRFDDSGNEVPPQLPAQAPPAKAPVVPLLVLLLILLLGACITSLFAFHQSLQSSMPGMYAILGMNQTDGLALADVIVRERPSRKRVRYVVEGNIVNESEETRDVPVLRVAIVDKNGEWLKSREYETEARLKPGESYAFKASNLDTAFQDRIDHLLIEIGNGVQLMLRQ